MFPVFIVTSRAKRVILIYMVISIPRFILIDSEGRVLDANAPRPSGKRIYTCLDSCLKKTGEAN